MRRGRYDVMSTVDDGPAESKFRGCVLHSVPTPKNQTTITEEEEIDCSPNKCDCNQGVTKTEPGAFYLYVLPRFQSTEENHIPYLR